MGELSILDSHNNCILTTQQVIDGFGWQGITVEALNANDRKHLETGHHTGELDWAWAMERYAGDADDGILDISLKVVDSEYPDEPHAVILCCYDERRSGFAICMLENFILDQITPLTGNVLLIALIYATIFCEIYEIDEIIIEDPVERAIPRYRTYGFAHDYTGFNRMSATVADIKSCIRLKVQGITLDKEDDTLPGESPVLLRVIDQD